MKERHTNCTDINGQRPFSFVINLSEAGNGLEWYKSTTTILISFPLRRSPVSCMSEAHKCRIPFNENDTHCNNMKTGRLPLCYISIGISVCNTEGAILFVTVFAIVCRFHYVYTTSIDFSALRKFLWLKTNGIKENVQYVCASRLLFTQITQKHTVFRLLYV